jgi:hypothetical protein
MVAGLLRGGVVGERHRRGGAHWRMGLDSRVDVWRCGLSSMGLWQGHVAPGGQGPLTGGPRAEETTTNKWARSYLISIRNKCQKTNSPREK